MANALTQFDGTRDRGQMQVGIVGVAADDVDIAHPKETAEESLDRRTFHSVALDTLSLEGLRMGLRGEVAGGCDQVTARGVERRSIFRDDGDAEDFVELLGQEAARFDFVVHARVLMDNHYHLLLRTGQANTSGAIIFAPGGGESRNAARVGSRPRKGAEMR